MKWLKTLLLIAMLATSSIGAAAAPGDIQLFRSEQQAQQHCPADTVVWVNTPTVI
jgi:hypothetical protein